MHFTTELRKVFRVQMQSVLASDALASPQQTPKWTEWLFKMLREKVYCMSHLEGLKIVFVKAYTYQALPFVTLSLSCLCLTTVCVYRGIHETLGFSLLSFQQ